MEFEIKNTTKAEIFASIFQHLKAITEHINIQFSPENGLFIQGMDSSHVSIYELRLPSDWFDRYTIVAPVCLGINANILFKILNAREKTQEMLFVFSAATDDKAFIYFQNGREKTEFDKTFEMPLVDLTTEMLEIPEIEYQAEFSLLSTKIYSIVNQLKTFGDTMDIICSEEKIVICADGQSTGKMSVEVDISELSSYAIEEGKEIHLSYSLNYIGNICMFYKLAREVELFISGDYPLKMKYNIGCGGGETAEAAATAGEASMVFYLAPKMSDD